MANVAIAGVEIFGVGCGVELKSYIEAAQKDAIWNIVDNDDEWKIDENNKLYTSGVAEGRWTYQRNLEGYFDDKKRNHWTNEQGNTEWATLVEKLKSGAVVKINYHEKESGLCFVSRGNATLKWENKAVFTHVCDTYDFTLENLMKVTELSREDAIHEACGRCEEADCPYCGGVKE